MKKTVALAIIAIFIFSLMPLAFAQNVADIRKEVRDKREDVRDKHEDIRDKKEDILDRANADRQSCIEKCRNEGKQGCEARCKAADLKEDARDTREDVRDKREDARDRLENMREKNRERLAKIQGIDQRHIERLSAIDNKNVEKIAQLKKERLDKLAKLSEEKLKRISELDKEKLEKVSGLSETEIEKFSALNRARTNELAKLDEKRLKAELKALKVVKVKNAEAMDKRNISEARLALANQRFENAREKFQEAKFGLNEAREKLKEARDKKNESAALEHAKNYLLRTADALINHLEKIKAKVQESENIAADMEAKIIAETDAQIAEINRIKEDARSATTKEQVKAAAKKLHDKWKKLKHLIKLHADRVVSARVEGLVNQGIVLEKRIDHILGKAREKGIEVDVSAEVEAFSGKIAAAKDKHRQAQEKLSAMLDLKAGNATEEEIKAAADEAKALLKEARDAIKEAHDTLKAIVKKIKEAASDSDLSEEVEVEVEQEEPESGSGAEPAEAVNATASA